MDEFNAKNHDGDGGLGFNYTMQKRIGTTKEQDKKMQDKAFSFTNLGNEDKKALLSGPVYLY